MSDGIIHGGSDSMVPGEGITSEQGYLRGHGTYIEGDELIACVAGQMERVNKLISVKPLKSRYIGEMGDLVVGRITYVESKRWKADIGSNKDCVLQLSSVNLPGGVQRVRTYEDQLQMKTLFKENDLISAEIQNISSDGVVSLHTRSLKYGKLENGQLIVVPSILVKRLPQHYISLPIGIDIILGKNGFIWITRSIPEEWKVQAGTGDDDIVPLAETLQSLKQRHANTEILIEDRKKIARITNSIYVLSVTYNSITPQSIQTIYNLSEELNISVKDMLTSSNIAILISQL